MSSALLMLGLKLLTLVGAVAQTVGFIGFFAFEALQEHRLQLLIGGTLVVVVSEGLSYWLGRRLAAQTVDETP